MLTYEYGTSTIEVKEKCGFRKNSLRWYYGYSEKTIFAEANRQAR